jgi:hypothetical protein
MKGGVIMQINPDLIRDILLKAELGSYSILGSADGWFDDDGKNYQKPKELSSYSDKEIEYHVNYLNEIELLITKVNYGKLIDILDLTVKGHDFVSNIKNDENWNKIKEISDNIGSSSVETLIKISDKLISELIDKQFIQHQ